MQGIKYISLLEPSGYGVAGLRYLRGLVAAGVPVTWTPMVPGKAWGLGYEPARGGDIDVPGLSGLCNREIEYDTVIVHTVPEYFERWARLESGKGRKVVGYTVWETDKPPAHWPRMLDTMDGVLVPCFWNKEVFQRHGVTVPVEVVPHSIDESPPAATRDGSWDIRPGEYVFYTINTWTNRKSPWNTIRAFLEAFEREDPVAMIVKTSAEDLSRTGKVAWKTFGRRRHRRAVDAIEKIVGEYRHPARIQTMTRFVDEPVLAGLHKRADCYATLCHSEGWGLGAFDAANHARPIIMTGYGGQRDYLDAENSYLVDYELVPVHDPCGVPSYTPDQCWAEPDVDQASRLMRHVFENRDEAAERGRRVCRLVREDFSAKRVTALLLDVLERIG